MPIDNIVSNAPPAMQEWVRALEAKLVEIEKQLLATSSQTVSQSRNR